MTQGKLAPLSNAEQDEHFFRQQNIDAVLLSFVEEANVRKGAFLGITLLTHGLIVSGTLVGASEYLREASKNFVSDGEEPEDGTWGAWFVEMAADLEAQIDQDHHYPVSHIHLKDAQVYSNDKRPIPSSSTVWWRGKMTSIDGFWIGRLMSSES